MAVGAHVSDALSENGNAGFLGEERGLEGLVVRVARPQCDEYVFQHHDVDHAGSDGVVAVQKQVTVLENCEEAMFFLEVGPGGRVAVGVGHARELCVVVKVVGGDCEPALAVDVDARGLFELTDLEVGADLGDEQVGVRLARGVSLHLGAGLEEGPNHQDGESESSEEIGEQEERETHRYGGG